MHKLTLSYKTHYTKSLTRFEYKGDPDPEGILLQGIMRPVELSGLNEVLTSAYENVRFFCKTPN